MSNVTFRANSSVRLRRMTGARATMAARSSKLVARHALKQAAAIQIASSS